MGSFSIWHWIIVFGILAPMIWASARILRRIGFSRWWAVLAIAWPLNLIGLIVLALIRWPIERRGSV